MTLSFEGWLGPERRRFERISTQSTDFEAALQAFEAQAEALGADAVIGVERTVDLDAAPPLFAVTGIPVLLEPA